MILQYAAKNAEGRLGSPEAAFAFVHSLDALRYRLHSLSRLPSFRESLRLYSVRPNLGAGMIDERT